ncbi:D-glycero-beta-D-manno-heptose 1,7-bisphosphate 7-phosphatase [Persephonella sp.]
MGNKAVFLDRDGVINIDYGYVHKIKDFHIYKEVFPALKKLQDEGFKLLIVTNQSGIAVGYYTLEDFKNVTNYMLDTFRKEGIFIDKVYYCPHHPEGIIPEFKKVCECRKPESGMIRAGIEEFNIDPEKSFLIGDKENDIKAAHKENIKAALVKTGQGLKFVNNTEADFVGENILDVVDNFILKERG